jgi:O-antigen/teichoic acid export membrane protein
MVAQKLIVSYGAKMVVQLIQIIASIVVARIAGPTILGTVAFGLAFVSIFEFIADLGMGTAHMKLVSAGEDLGKCISTFRVIKSSLTILFFVFVLGVFLIQKFVFGYSYETRAHEYVIIITLFAVTVQQFIGVQRMTFAALTEQTKYSIPELVKTLSNQIMRISVVLLGFRAIALASVNLLSTVFSGIMALLLFRGYPISNFDMVLARKYLKIALPVMVIGMSTNVVYYLDKVLLQYFTNAEQVGFYTAGYRIGGFVQLVSTSAGLLFLPLFSSAVARGDVAYVKKTIEKFEHFSFVFIMPAVIILSIYSGVVINVVLGPQYSASVPVMVVINFATFLMVLNVPYGNVITGMGFFKLAAILNVANMLFFALFMWILPNPNFLNMGALGVGVAVLLSTAFLGILYRFYACRYLPTLHVKNSVRYIIFGVIAYVAGHQFYRYIGTAYGVSFKIAFIPFFLLLAYLLMAVFGWIAKEDIKRLGSIFDLRRMIEYIRREMKGERKNGKE